MMVQSWISIVRGSFRDAGPYGYLILILFAGSVVLVIERTVRLYWHYPGAPQPLQDLIGSLEHGALLETALSHLPARSRSLPVLLVHATLTGAQRSPHAAADTLNEAMTAFPRLPFRHLHLLRSLAWLAVVLGALVTILGLLPTIAFYALAPEEKNNLLTKGFSEALNGTLHGFITALFCHLASTVLRGRARRLVEDLELTALGLTKRLELQEVPERRYLRTGSGRRQFAPARAAQVAPYGWRARGINFERPGSGRTPPLAPQMDQPASSHFGPLPGLGAFPFMLIGLMAFQLRVYTTTPSLYLPDDLGLPISNSTAPLQEAITVEIDDDWIKIDDKRVAEGFHDVLDAAQLEALEARLRDRAEHMAKIESMGGPVFEWHLLIAADRTMRYGLLKQVMDTATTVGFKDFGLAVYAFP